MKKMLSFIVVMVLMVTLFACGEKKTTTKVKNTTIAATTTTVKVTTVGNTTVVTTKEASTTVTTAASTKSSTTVTTKASTTKAPTTKAPTTVGPTTATTTVAPSNPKMFVVGDSTVCDFGTTDAKYYYPRYGYATQFSNYFTGIDVVNLALSGRSSKSFLIEPNYTTMTGSISNGDYLVIGFGHNDEKAEDARYTNPVGDVTSETSFKYSLYNYYAKIAIDKGATPILVTPIVRRSTSNDYTGSNGHITSTVGTYEGGDYAQAIRDLGTEKGIQVVDLTTITKNLYTTMGADQTVFLHAWINSKPASVDNTHINIYGAKVVAHQFAKVIKESSCSLKNYANATITEPIKENDLISNPSYVESVYNPVWTPSTKWTTTSPWYGTVFGDCGGASKISTDNFTITQTGETFNVTAGVASNVGKMAATSSDGFAFLFQQLDYNRDFTFSAKATVNSIDNANNQVSFGLMVRDDIHIDTYDTSILSNYFAAGSVKYNADEKWVNFGRISTAITQLNKGTEVPVVGDEIEISIVRRGTSLTLTYDGIESVYVDFDLKSVDSEHIFVGMYAARRANITFSNVVLTDDGVSAEA